MDKNSIIEAARKYLDIPYRHQGRCVAGMDCIGLVIAVGRDLGCTLDDIYAYEKIPDPQTLYEGLDANFTRVLRYQPGDILVLRINREPQHIAIYTGSTMIHSYERAGKVCENRFSEGWRARVLRSYKYE